MNLEEIKQAIKEWGNARTSPKTVLSYLKQGCCFKIERAQFEQWNRNSPEKLHAYLGIFGNKLNIVLIDSVSDKNPAAHLDSIFIQDYLKGLSKEEEGYMANATDGGITIADAQKKMTKWKASADLWVEDKAKTSAGIFKAFLIPFSDLKSQFEGTSNPASAVFLGLNISNEADMILWGLKPIVNQANAALKFGEDGTPVEDLTLPIPPYGEEGLGLLE
ncbi:MAG: hypothetical protein NTY07_05230 [Bacteroidia bacterium]|nr:hypothetical protein [Bacteroidia bacterium]